MEITKRIVGKAHDLFINYGIRSVRMDDIATGLGISKKTIYRFFTDKNSLVEAFVEEEIENNTAIFKTIKARNRDGVFELFFILFHINELYRHLSPAIIHDLDKYHTASYQKLLFYREGYLFKTIEDTIKKGVKEALYRNDFNLNGIINYMLEGVTVILNAKTSVKAVPPEEIFSFLISGIVTADGASLINEYRNHAEMLSLLISGHKEIFWDH